MKISTTKTQDPKKLHDAKDLNSLTPICGFGEDEIFL